MRHGLVSPALLAGLLAVVLTGCGGKSSSSTGPSASGGGSGGGAVVQGQVVRSQSAALQESTLTIVLRTALGVGLAEAAAGDPVSGVTVVLTPLVGTPLTATTDLNGNFLFTNVPAGTYTLSVDLPYTLDAGTSTTSLVVGEGDTATIAGKATLTNVSLTLVTVVATDVSNLLQNQAQLCHAINIANASNSNVADVIAYRQAGHGWGQTAQHFGAASSVIGLHGNCSPAAVEAAAEAAGGQGQGKGKGKGQGQGQGQS